MDPVEAERRIGHLPMMSGLGRRRRFFFVFFFWRSMTRLPSLRDGREENAILIAEAGRRRH